MARTTCKLKDNVEEGAFAKLPLPQGIISISNIIYSFFCYAMSMLFSGCKITINNNSLIILSGFISSFHFPFLMIEILFVGERLLKVGPYSDKMFQMVSYRMEMSPI